MTKRRPGAYRERVNHAHYAEDDERGASYRSTAKERNHGAGRDYADDDIEESSYVLKPQSASNGKERRFHQSKYHDKPSLQDGDMSRPMKHRSIFSSARGYDTFKSYSDRDNNNPSRKYQSFEPSGGYTNSSENSHKRQYQPDHRMTDRVKHFATKESKHRIDVPKSSPLLSRCVRLISSKSFRDKERSIIVPGIVAIQSCNKDTIKSVLACSKDAVEKLDKSIQLSKSTRIEYITDSQLQSLTNEKNPHVVVAEVEKPVIASFHEGLLSGKKRFIAINGLRDGANLGLLIRSAGCMNWDGVIIVGSGNVDPFNIQTIRASAGAVFKVPLYQTTNFDDLKAAQVVLAEIPDKANETEGGIDVDGPVVLVIGGEQQGHAMVPIGKSHHMTIPTNPSFGSLNAAIAGAIMMNMINQNVTKIN